MKARATYTVKAWEESTYKEISPEMKMTRASVEYGFNRDLQGTATAEYLMHYTHVDLSDQHNSTASYIGLIRFEGTLGGKAGSVVMKDDGTFAGGSADSRLEIMKGSGSDSLEGIAGTGSYRANRDGLVFELEYEVG